MTPKQHPSHRTKIVAFRLTADDYERLNTFARARGMQIGEWCRELALRFARNPEGDGFQQLLLAEMIAMRDTMNQLAYYDAEGYRVNAATLRTLVKEVEQTKRTKALNLLRTVREEGYGVPPPQGEKKRA